MRDIIYVAGHGKLAMQSQQRLRETAPVFGVALDLVDNWDNFPAAVTDNSRMVIVHAGSGKDLNDILACCQAHRIPLIQSSTGMAYQDGLLNQTDFIFVDAPNLSVPMIKFLYLLEEMGPLFFEYDVSITESHQSSKTSPPGTALEMVKSLRLKPDNLKSIRDEGTQKQCLGIATEYLAQHALHLIEISAGGCKISLKTEVYGLETYLEGLVKIIQNIDRLSSGRHGLSDLVKQRLV